MSDTQAATTKAVTLTPDICVIGAGSGGVALATAAAAFGVQVVLIERGEMGGPRLAPRRAALRAAASRARMPRQADGFGLAMDQPAISFTRVRDHVERAAAGLLANDTAERMGALGVVVLKGEARFASRSTVKVGEQSIKARRFVVATGSKTAMPQIAGLDALPVLTPETLLGTPQRPDRLIVLGAGSAGVEIAQAMARLGSAVTLVASDDLLPEEDPEAAALVRRSLLRDGIALHEQAAVLRAEAMRGGVRLVLAQPGSEETQLDGTHLLVAAGRQPEIDRLDLDMAGIASQAGGIVVDHGLRTRNRRVFAIGSCACPRPDSRAGQDSVHQAGRVLRNLLFRLPSRQDGPPGPYLTSCDPELASVGLSEAQARARDGAVTTLRWPYAEIARAHAERETEGFLKVLCDRKGRILGATIVGAHAGDLIAPWCLALQKRLRIQDMAALNLPGPSFAELSARAATSFYAPLAAKPGIRRLIGFLRRFG